jgi:hypothetical protein
VTVQPTREEFVALAADHGVVPVWRELLADLETPLSVLAKLGRADGGPHETRWRHAASCSSPPSTANGGGATRSWGSTRS